MNIYISFVCRFVRRSTSSDSFLMVLVVLVLSPGDQIAGMLAVAVASSRTLEVLDLEGTGLTNQSAQVDQSHFFFCVFFIAS